ncbi:hypothetical protein NR798_07100 [Archangium gephyra]|uniref:hypothetical protein n=1 Tax=Archangium gephyra TaxID=48 RepID=UPI0035D485C0
MLRTAVTALALALACAACSSIPRLEDTVSKEQLNPVRVLPQNAPLYARVSQDGWREAHQLASDVLGPRLLGPGRERDLLSPALLLALEPLLAGDAALPGWDSARPAFFSFGSARTERLERVVSLGGLIEEADLPPGMHTVALFPAVDEGALAARLEQWWKETASGEQPVVHRIQSLRGWVRLDLFGGRAFVDEQGMQAGLEQALSSPAPAHLRLTPALAAFVSGRADVALYVPFDRVRPTAAAQSAIGMVDAVRNVRPGHADMIMAMGSSEMAQQWMLLDPSSAELEDLLLTLELQKEHALTVDLLTTRTELGRRLAAEEGGTRMLPRFADGPSFLDVRMSGTYGPAMRAVPLPRVVQLRLNQGSEHRGDAPMAQVAELFEVAGSWGYLSVLQSPSAWVRLASIANLKVNALPTPVALTARLLPFTSTSLAQGELPRAALVLAFTTAAEADEFLFQMRQGGGTPQGLSAQRLPSAEGGLAYAFFGLGLTPEQVLAPGGALEAIRPGATLTVAPGVAELFGGRLPPALRAMLAQGPAQLTIDSQAPVGHSRLQVGTPAQAAEATAPLPAFEAISRGDPRELCRFELATPMANTAKALADLDPADRATLMAAALAEFDASVARCAQQDPALAKDAQLVRDRATALGKRLAELEQQKD